MLSTVFQHILVDGLLFSLIIGALVMGSLWYNPRLWLQDYPQVVRDKVPPMNAQEKRLQKFIAVPFLLLMIAAPYLSVTLVKAVNGGVITFPLAYLTAAGVLEVFNLFDAVVLDYLILTRMKPAFAIVPGTTSEECFDVGLAFQLRNFLKGVVITALLSLPIAFVASL
jgi:hypothetical protein